MCSIWTAEGFVFVHCCTEVLEKLVSHMRHKPLHAHAVGYLTLFPPWSSAQGLAVKLAALTGSHQRRSPQCLVQAVKTRHKAACRCCLSWDAASAANVAHPPARNDIIYLRRWSCDIWHSASYLTLRCDISLLICFDISELYLACGYFCLIEL